MPGYMATVIGENFEFVVEDELQQLEFSRTLYVNADNESAAEAAALQQVREDLQALALLDDEADQLITVEDICQDDVPGDELLSGDFIWVFPEEEFYDEVV